MREKIKLDTKLRFALWEAYNNKCAYTGEYTDFDDIEIEHIIPRNQSGILEEKIREYNLSNEFGINSLENLLPVKRKANILKGRHPFDHGSELFYIQLAKKNKPKVLEQLSKLEKILENKRNILLELAAKENSFFTKKPPFRVCKKINKADIPFTSSSYFNSTEDIVLNGTVPSIFKESGNCVIEFRHENIMITLDNPQILDLLTQQKECKINDLFFRGKHPENGNPFVVINNNALFLEDEIFANLIEIIEDYLLHFREGLKEFEDFIGARNFMRYDKEHYILAETSRANWRKLIEYSRKYDMDNKDSNLNFHFNYNGNTIIALDNKSYDISFELIPAKTDFYSYGEFWYPDNDLLILWRVPNSISRQGIKEKTVWRLKDTFDWVMTIIGNEQQDKSSNLDNIKNKVRYLNSLGRSKN